MNVKLVLHLLNSDETLFYPLTVSVNKCGERGNTIDFPYVQVRVPNKGK